MRKTIDYRFQILLGNRLRHMRLRKGMTQATLARSLGYAHPSSISCIEKGRRRINEDELKRITCALGCSIDALLDGIL